MFTAPGKMRTLAVISSKGGSGKTTLALHLAAVAAAAGRRTMVADTDPQKSACAWRRVRTEPDPDVSVVQGHTVRRVLPSFEGAGYDLVVVDTPPIAGTETLDAIRAADLTLIVARPSMLDLWSVEYSAEQVRFARGHGLFVVTQAPSSRGGVENAAVVSAVKQLTSYGYPVAPVGMRARVAYSSSIGMGKTALELEPEGMAAREVRRLAEVVFERLWPSPES
jgi:chromosome partitioning protein